MKPYESLANAIIVQAVKDFKDAFDYYKAHPEKKEYEDDVRDLEWFFRSNWYQLLTSLDGEVLMAYIKKGVHR